MNESRIKIIGATIGVLGVIISLGSMALDSRRRGIEEASGAVRSWQQIVVFNILLKEFPKSLPFEEIRNKYALEKSEYGDELPSGEFSREQLRRVLFSLFERRLITATGNDGFAILPGPPPLPKLIASGMLDEIGAFMDKLLRSQPKSLDENSLVFEIHREFPQTDEYDLRILVRESILSRRISVDGEGRLYVP